jgi:heme oxygenase
MVMKKLKEATRDQHEGLENTVDVMKGSLSKEDYKNLLLKFYRFYAPVEEEISKLDWDEIGYSFEGRRKVPKLEDDLEFLGASEERKNLEPWTGIPNIEDQASGLGVLYVLEGATLGGQIINRHLREHLGVEPGSGASFFSGYGPETGRMWKEFAQLVDAYSGEFGGDEKMIRAARETFDSFRDCFVDSEAG